MKKTFLLLSLLLSLALCSFGQDKPTPEIVDAFLTETYPVLHKSNASESCEYIDKELVVTMREKYGKYFDIFTKDLADEIVVGVFQEEEDPDEFNGYQITMKDYLLAIQELSLVFIDKKTKQVREFHYTVDELKTMLDAFSDTIAQQKAIHRTEREILVDELDEFTRNNCPYTSDNADITLTKVEAVDEMVTYYYSSSAEYWTYKSEDSIILSFVDNIMYDNSFLYRLKKLNFGLAYVYDVRDSNATHVVVSFTPEELDQTIRSRVFETKEKAENALREFVAYYNALTPAIIDYCTRTDSLVVNSDNLIVCNTVYGLSKKDFKMVKKPFFKEVLRNIFESNDKASYMALVSWRTNRGITYRYTSQETGQQIDVHFDNAELMGYGTNENDMSK